MNELKKIVQDMRAIVGLDLPSHCHGLQHGIQEFADRLEALSQTHVLVPREPTVKMNNAGLGAGFPHEVWAAMIRAAEGGEQ